MLGARKRQVTGGTKMQTVVPAATRLKPTSSYVRLGMSLGFGTKDFLGSV